MMTLLFRDLDIESCIDECRLIIEKLRTPEKEPEFTEIMMSPFFGVAKDILEIKHKELTNSRQGLQALWQQAEERVSSSSKIGKYRAKAEKVGTIICRNILYIMWNLEYST